MGIVVVLVLVEEVATGLYTQGAVSIPTMLGEASRLIVLAGVLWGTGDLAHLLIDVGHDVRAARILMARVAHANKVPPLVAGGAAGPPPRHTPPPPPPGAPRRQIKRLGRAAPGPPTT